VNLENHNLKKLCHFECTDYLKLTPWSRVLEKLSGAVRKAQKQIHLCDFIYVTASPDPLCAE